MDSKSRDVPLHTILAVLELRMDNTNKNANFAIISFDLEA